MSREAPNSPRPAAPQSVEELEELLSRPTPRVVDAMRRLTGDLLILGVGGKMGPTLARMARRASDAAGVPRTIWGVSRFTSPATRARLEAQGITTIACDLLDAAAVDQLPSAPNVLFMTGMKFGAAHNPPLAWAMHCHAPALVCQKYRTSRIVAFSTGNVYGLVPASSGGSRETDPPRPDGEYAMMALGRERMFQYFSATHSTPVALVRLNYATELRYGVLVDLALDVHAGRPVDVSMGSVNVLWLTDANAMTLAAFDHAAAPARIINMAGPEILSLREVAQRMAAQFGIPVQLTGCEGPDALLNDGRGGYPLLGHPLTTADDMIRWTVEWVARGGENLGKPTRFQVRDGKF